MSTIVVPPAIVINTSLALHQFKTYHASQLFHVIDRNRDHLRPWFDWADTTRDVDDGLKFIHRFKKEAEENSGFHYGIWHHETLVGVAGVHIWEPENCFAELYYWLDKEKTGRGFVGLSCQAIINWLFNETETGLVQICCEPDNWQSANVARRLGFDYAGQDEQIDCTQEVLDQLARQPSLAAVTERVCAKLTEWGVPSTPDPARQKVVLDMFQLTHETWSKTWHHIPSPG